MYDVYVYDKSTNDFSNLGIAGALTPSSCCHEEIAGGMSAVTLEHPIDEAGRWRALSRGNILKVMTSLRTTPEIEEGSLLTSVESWHVKPTATKAERYVYSKKVDGKKLKLLKAQDVVTVVKRPSGADRYKIKKGSVTGWIAASALAFELATNLSNTPAAIESAAPSQNMREQLFRIIKETRTEKQITVEARHISYDLLGNITTYKNNGTVSLTTALNGILDNCVSSHDFTAVTNIADERTGVDWRMKNPIFAFLDPDDGVMARWPCELLRDNWELYFLSRAGLDRGLSVEYGRNLEGITCDISEDELVTRVIPTGFNKDGGILYLTDDVNGTNWLDSDYISSYPAPHVYVLECENCTVDDEGLTTEIVRRRMREQAAELLASGVSQATISLRVSFSLLGESAEYAQFKNLEQIYLYDTVHVRVPHIGLSSDLNVVRVKRDCLTGKLIEAEIGAPEDTLASVESFQISGIGGGKIFAGTISASSLADGSISTRHIQANTINADMIQANAITTASLAAGSITTEKLAAGVITAGQIAAGAVTADKIDAGAITADKIDAGAITAGKIAAGAITAVEIDAGAITADKLAAGCVTAEQIQTGVITADKMVSGLITAESGLVADGAILAAQIASLNADVIDAGTLSADRLLLRGEDGLFYKINAGAEGITQAELSDDKYKEYIDGSVLVAQSVTADQIKAGSIQAVNIDVADLFASSAFIQSLNVADIYNNSSIRMLVGDQQRNDYEVIVTADRTALTADAASITLTATLYRNGEDVTGLVAGECFEWSRTGGNPATDAIWSATGKTLTINRDMVERYAAYTCHVYSADEVDLGLPDGTAMLVDEDDVMLSDGQGNILIVDILIEDPPLAPSDNIAVLVDEEDVMLSDEQEKILITDITVQD